MREFGKIFIVSAIVSCCVSFGVKFLHYISTDKCKSLERRVVHLEQCKDAHRDLIQWLLVHYFVDEPSGYEITPETTEIRDGEKCEYCRNGGLLRYRCSCKYKTVKTGNYFLKKKAR